MKIKRNAAVRTADGEIGRVGHVIVDPQTREVTYLAVATRGGERLLPIGAVAGMNGDDLLLRDGTMLTNAPAFDRDAFDAVDDDDARGESRRLALHGGLPLLDVDRDAVVLADGAPVAAEQTSGGARFSADGGDARATAGAGSAERPYRLQLRRERLRPEARPEEAGAVLVHRRVTEHVETIEVPIREERLVLERRPGSGPVLIDDRVLQEGESIEILLMREQVVVRREPVAYEYVNIRRETVERMQHVEATVRSEELTVDDPTGAASSSGVAPAGHEGPLLTGITPARMAGPLGYQPGYRAEGPLPDAAERDAQPTEPLQRAAGDMYDPEPTPAVYGSVVPGQENTPVMEDRHDEPANDRIGRRRPRP